MSFILKLQALNALNSSIFASLSASLSNDVKLIIPIKIYPKDQFINHNNKHNIANWDNVACFNQNKLSFAPLQIASALCLCKCHFVCLFNPITKTRQACFEWVFKGPLYIEFFDFISWIDI